MAALGLTREEIGRVTEVHGKPFAIDRSGQYDALQPGDAVYLGDAILVGSGGRLSISFRDGGSMHLGPQARVLLKASAEAVGADVPPLQISLQKGEIVVVPNLGIGQIVHLDSPGGDVSGLGALAARVDASRSLDVTLLPQPGGHSAALDLVALEETGQLSQPFDHATLTYGRVPLRMDHLDCSDPQLQFAADLGLTGSGCAAGEKEATDEYDTSAGGDLAADSGTLGVTQPLNPFDLKPEAAPLADPTEAALVGAPVHFSVRSHLSDLLLGGLQDFGASSTGLLSLGSASSSGYDFSLMTSWDPGRTWRALGEHAELAPQATEVPLGGSRLITARSGEMAQLVGAGAAVGDMATFLGIPLNVPSISEANRIAGSAMRLETPLTLNAGETIRFDVFFDIADGAAGENAVFRDTPVFTITANGVSDLHIIGVQDSAGGIKFSEGWQSISYTAGQAGQYTFGFAVVNDGEGGASRLYVDNVRTQETSGFHYFVLGSAQGDRLGGSLQILAPAPIASDDVITVSAASPYTIDVARELLANDVDPDTFDPWIISGKDDSMSTGRVVIQTGHLIYQPYRDSTHNFDRLSVGEVGTDQFQYILDGGNGLQDSATVTVRVIGVNDAPTPAASYVAATAAENGAPVSILNILAGAFDIDSDYTPDKLQVISATSQYGASIVVGGDHNQNLTYDPSATTAFEYLGAGETVEDVTTYRIADQHGATATGQLRVTVQGANDLPTAGADAASTDQDTRIALNVLANDTDPDLHDRLRPVAVDGVAFAGASALTIASGARVSLTADGSLLYDPNGAFAFLAAGQTGQDHFVYQVSDNNGGLAEATVTLTVTGLNDAPIGVADAVNASEDGPTSVAISQLLANDHDPDQGDQIHFVAASGEGIRIEADRLVFDPGDRYQYLAEGTTATQLVHYTIADTSGASTTVDVTLTIHGVNDAPIAGNDFGGTIEEKQLIRLDVLANDHDVDVGDTKTIVSVDGQSIAAGGSVVLASGARVSLRADGTLDYDPNGAFTHLGFQERATETFTYTVADGHGATATASVADAGSLSQNGAITLNLLANDHDPDTHDVLQISGIAGKVAGTDFHFDNPLYLHGDPATSDWVLVSRTGQVTYNPVGQFASLAGGETATLRLTYTVSDGLAIDEGVVDLTITGINDRPDAVDDSGYGVDNKTVLDFPTVGGVLANDRDPDHGDAVRIVAVNGNATAVGQAITLASGALLTLNEDGSFRYDPNGRFDWLSPLEKTTDSFTYTIADNQGATDTATVTVEVQGHPNEPPVAVADTATTDSNAAIRLHVLANDSDPENAHLQIIRIDDDAHRNLVHINPDGTLTYDPAGGFDTLAAGQTATDTFTYTIDDDLGGRATAQVTITIVGTGGPTPAVKQTIVESFEQPFGAIVAGWGREPTSGNAANAVGLVSGFTAALAPYGPTHMGTAVLMRAEGVSAVEGAPDLQAYLGLPYNALPKDVGDGTGAASAAVSGSAIRTEITLTAADLNAAGKLIVSFDWNFLSAESVASGQPGANDYAIFTVSDGTTSRLLTLTDSRTTGLGASGWRTSTYDLTSVFGADIAAARSLTLGFAVLNDQNDQHPSSLLIDNLRLNAPVAADATLLSANPSAPFLTYVHAPTAVADSAPSIATSENAPITIAPATLLANDTPSPGTTGITFVGLDGGAGTGQVSYAGGQITYNPNGKFEALAEGEIGSDTFHYTITDANGGVGSGEVTVRITGVNDAPTTTAFVAAGVATENGASITIADVLAHADDVDSDDSSATLRVLSASAASGAGLQLSGVRGQNFIYDPSKTAAFESLGVGETAADTITYTVVDRHGATATGQLSLTVQGANDAPTAHDDTLAADEDHLATLAVLANDSDADRNDILKVARVNGQAISFGNPIALASGALILLSSDGRFLQFDPHGAYDRLNAGDSETVSFIYTATDNHGGFADATVALTIAGLNDTPLPAADTITTDEDHSVSVPLTNLLANDHDPDTGDVLHITAVQGTGAAIGGTALTYDPGNRFQYLAAGQTATEHLTYTATDAHGASAQGDITVIVEGRNDAPHAVADEATTREDQTVTVSPLVNDTDPDTADQGHLSVLSIDTHGTLGSVTLNADGSILYNPANQFNYLNGGQTATDTFSYTVGDGHGGTDTTTVTMTIEGRNSAEQIVQSFEPPFIFGLDPSVARANSFASTVTTYAETDVTPKRTFTPTDGATMVRLEANGSTIGSIESFLGLATGTIKNTFPQPDGSVPANSSAIKLSIDVHAGDQISFDWMFDARDYVYNPPDGKSDNDMAILTVTGVDGTHLYKLSDVQQTGDLGDSGWRSSAYTAQHDGTLTIGIASVNDRIAQTADNSIVLIDNLRLNRDFDQSYQLVQTSDDAHLHTYLHQS